MIKKQKQINGDRLVILTWFWNNWKITCQGINRKSEWVMELNEKNKAYKIEGKTCVTLESENEFLSIAPKVLERKIGC